MVFNAKPGWLDLLYVTRLCKSTDPRDRVFALAGLVNESKPVQVDYRMTTREVYANIARHIINSSKSLKILSSAFHPDPSATKGFPTWVTRWDIASESDVCLPLWVGDEYASSKASVAIWNEPFEPQLLTLRGLRVDTANRVGRAGNSFFGNRLGGQTR